MIKQVGLSLQLAEAFPCRLDNIKAKLREYSKDLKPDSFLQLTVLLGKMEQLLGIEYAPCVRPSTNTKPTCVVCSRSYTRTSSLNHHISHRHSYLQSIIEEKSCHSCGTDLGSHKQLVSHERAVHKAAYQSRADFIWPGFVQLDSKEAQKSFLNTLRGDEQGPNFYDFVREAAATTCTPPEAFVAVEGRQFDEQYSVDGQASLQYDLGYYADLESLLLPYYSTNLESSV
ncbi:hypothetical protein BJX70DRAFT_390570 [Aspergillus crustosus]